MRPVEQAIEQLRRANPVPDPAALARQLAEAAEPQRERNQMNTTVTDAKRPTPRGRPRGWTVGLTAAVLVLIVGVATVFMTTGPNPFAGGDTPVEVAEAYIDARNDYDLEGARELLADGYMTTEAPYGHSGHATLERAFQSWETWGFQFTEVTCDELSAGSGGHVVRCDYLWNNHLIEAGGFPPSKAHLQLLIVDGLILRVSETEVGTDPWWDTFINFLEAESANDFGDTVRRAVDLLEPEAAQTVSEELPAYLDRYAEWRASQ